MKCNSDTDAFLQLTWCAGMTTNAVNAPRVKVLNRQDIISWACLSSDRPINALLRRSSDTKTIKDPNDWRTAQRNDSACRSSLTPWRQWVQSAAEEMNGQHPPLSRARWSRHIVDCQVYGPKAVRGSRAEGSWVEGVIWALVQHIHSYKIELSELWAVSLYP